MNESKDKRHKGFTLIEIIVSMAIIVILATSAAVISSSFSKKQNINIAYDNLKTTLSQAKSYSLSHVVFECNASMGKLIGYEVIFDSTTTYSIHEVCELRSDGNITVLDPAIKTFSLPNSVEFSGSLTSIRFKGLKGGAVGGEVEFTDGSRTRSIIVTNSGVIQENED